MVNMKNTTPKRARGRPRNFDKDEALAISLDLFRKKGFDNTSIGDLTEALNLNKPSLYAAFGNKETLFSEILNAYISGPASYFFEVFNEPTTKALVRSLLTKSIEILFYSEQPHGCLIVMSTASEELQKAGIQQSLVASLKEHQQKLVERFERAQAEGEFEKEVDPKKLALYVVTLHKGLSLQAINGSNKQEMLALVDQVIDLWPSK
jgi:AcrR family transcriptional regulator